MTFALHYFTPTVVIAVFLCAQNMPLFIFMVFELELISHWNFIGASPQIAFNSTGKSESYKLYMGISALCYLKRMASTEIFLTDYKRWGNFKVKIRSWTNRILCISLWLHGGFLFAMVNITISLVHELIIVPTSLLGRQGICREILSKKSPTIGTIGMCCKYGNPNLTPGPGISMTPYLVYKWIAFS